MRPTILGILNVTPDSFSDGGRFTTAESAIEHGIRLKEEGADWIDVGGESTRPGAFSIYIDEELRRVMPVIEGLVKNNIAVSIDTSKPEVARQAIAAGAKMVNDVTGLANPEMVRICAESQTKVCIMHMRGNPRSMQSETHYDDLIGEISSELRQKAENAQAHGILRENIILDPGLGFAKNAEQNWELLRAIPKLKALGYPLMIGLSRKSFLGKLLNDAPPEQRITAGVTAQLEAVKLGANYIRTHDVKPFVDALKVLQALAQP